MVIEFAVSGKRGSEQIATTMIAAIVKYSLIRFMIRSINNWMDSNVNSYRAALDRQS